MPEFTARPCATTTAAAVVSKRSSIQNPLSSSFHCFPTPLPKQSHSLLKPVHTREQPGIRRKPGFPRISAVYLEVNDILYLKLRKQWMMLPSKSALNSLKKLSRYGTKLAKCTTQLKRLTILRDVQALKSPDLTRLTSTWMPWCCSFSTLYVGSHTRTTSCALWRFNS